MTIIEYVVNKTTDKKKEQIESLLYEIFVKYYK